MWIVSLFFSTIILLDEGNRQRERERETERQTEIGTEGEREIIKETSGLLGSDLELGTRPARLVKPGSVGMCPGLLRTQL